MERKIFRTNPVRKIQIRTNIINQSCNRSRDTIFIKGTPEAMKNLGNETVRGLWRPFFWEGERSQHVWTMGRSKS